MADLKVYYCRYMNRRLRTSHKQTNIAVAATSRKRASELTGISVGEYATYGNVLDSKHDISKMALAEPETPFVEVATNSRSYIRLADLDARGDDPAQDDDSGVITLPDRSVELYGQPERHPAFGQISVMRVQGKAALFMVDYPQHHFVELEIKLAEKSRRHSGDNIHERETVLRLALSQVQWSALIASSNSAGVPCTLRHYTDPRTGEFVTPVLEHSHAGTEDTLRAEVAATAAQAAMSFDEASQIIDSIMAGGAPKKSDVARAQEALRMAKQQLTANVGFVVERAEEAIDKAIGAGKASFDGHIEHALARLGERAMGERIAAAVTAEELRDVGQRVLDATFVPEPQEQAE